MPRIRSLAPVLLVLLTLIGCSSIRVTTDYDPDADFAGLDSYAWMERAEPRAGGDPRVEGNTLLAGRIRRAVDDALAARGLTQVPPEQASVLVTYHVSIDQRFSVDTARQGYYDAGGWDQVPGAGFSRTTTTVRQYDQGTLILDLVDPARMELLWRGTAEAKVKRSSTPQDRQRRIQEAVSRMLAEFPPPTGTAGG